MTTNQDAPRCHCGGFLILVHSGPVWMCDRCKVTMSESFRASTITEPSCPKPRAADDFEQIRRRLDELRQ